MLAAAPGVASAAPNAAFVTDQDSANVAQFTISTSQTLSFNGSATSDSGPHAVAATPNGKYLYATNYGAGNNYDRGDTVSQYSIGADGTLTPLSPASVTTTAGPLQIAVSPDGKNAYVASDGGGPNGNVTEYSIAADGTLHQIGTLNDPNFNFPSGVAVSPDGTSVYVADQESGSIFEFNRASDGTLTAKSTGSVSFNGGYNPVLALTPDGNYLYAAGDSGEIDQYSVGSGGQLSPLTVPSVTTLGSTLGLVVSPNGQNVYTSNCINGPASAINQFSVGSNGELAPLTPATVPMDGCGMPWMTASGSSLFAPDENQSVYQFSVASSGVLSPKSPATVTDSSAADLFALVIPPDQGPVAKFAAKTKGKKVQFNASKSSDSDGKVVSYHWSFGDGSSLTTKKSSVTHTYKKAGKHKVTLTVTDDAGCSMSLVFTGQTAYCVPGLSASHTVNVKAAVVRRLRLTVTPSTSTAGQTVCYAFTVTSKGKPVNKSTVTLRGRHGNTNKAGHTTLCLKLAKGRHQARATRSGYRPATAAIRVIAAPAFTG
jgi:DNA-binding beta-propeller fold protein YncE